ncbi:hypothetical protein P0G38_09285 [Enterococcus casseliflavus]|uniref:hypothetical protein n=1 Tax=Enterococcus casseliflavus TaxID=37734 RepID=UPI0023D9E790|nr:hypothetical protein [Enterococcus casseliflavus]WEL45967.1 hypothetical protein P0G38_09285 [Enterococcus casseliflavus]
MTVALSIFLAVVCTIFASVIFGKELDEKEKQAIAKEKVRLNKTSEVKERNYEGGYFMEQDGFDSGNYTDGTNKRN